MHIHSSADSFTARPFTARPSPGVRMILRRAKRRDGASYRVDFSRDLRQRGTLSSALRQQRGLEPEPGWMAQEER